jgi:hypothetical protein
MSAPTYELGCAPEGTEHYVDIRPAYAEQLAFYKADDLPGILAPRAWHCFASGASPGFGLTVAPDPIKPFSGGRRPTHAVHIGVTYSDTLGRFGVARVVARLFPVAWPYARQIAQEATELDITFGPFPTDQLVYRGTHMVQFRTPAYKKGFGTEFFGFEPGEEPVRGIVVLAQPSGYVFSAAVRLPKNLSPLTSTIIRHVRASEDWSAPH